MTANTPVGIKCYKISGVNTSVSILNATCEPQGLTVIAEDGSDSRMADVIWVDDGARNPKVPTLFQVADVDTGVINWGNADLVTHIVPRC